MNAYVVVFHPGFYGKKPQKEAFTNCLEALKEVVETMKASGIKNVGAVFKSVNFLSYVTFM